MPSSRAPRSQAAARPADHRADVDAARSVRLRVEEDLGVDHVVGGRAFEVGERHVGEVALVQQHAGAGVVDVEEALQIGEGIGGAQGLDVRIGERDAVALRQREDQLGLERALDVDVQLGLRHRPQQFRQARSRDGVEIDHVGLFRVKDAVTPLTPCTRPPAGGLVGSVATAAVSCLQCYFAPGTVPSTPLT